MEPSSHLSRQIPIPVRNPYTHRGDVLDDKMASLGNLKGAWQLTSNVGWVRIQWLPLRQHSGMGRVFQVPRIGQVANQREKVFTLEDHRNTHPKESISKTATVSKDRRDFFQSTKIYGGTHTHTYTSIHKQVCEEFWESNFLYLKHKTLSKFLGLGVESRSGAEHSHVVCQALGLHPAKEEEGC